MLMLMSAVETGQMSAGETTSISLLKQGGALSQYKTFVLSQQQASVLSQQQTSVLSLQQT